tara:strand:+ start:229 stop:645 length:417 start_codon:yes stop_codon:yes gene_type:complete
MKRIFPIYPKTSGSHVSQKRIDKLKQKAIEIISKNEQSIILAFRKLISRYSKHVTMDLKLDVAIRKIKNAVVCRESIGEWGFSDEDTIWIPTIKMNDTFLLGILLHEALHYCCSFNGKDICSKDEHYVMRLLGEECEK